MTVTVLTLAAPDLGPDVSMCEGSSTAFVVSPNGANVLWSTGASTPTLTVTEPGIYTVTLDSLGCTASDAVRVTTIPLVSAIDLGSDRTLCPGAYDVLQVTPIAGATYTWSTGATGEALSISSPGTYSVVASGTCIDATATVVISAGDCDTYIYVPNTFTPNNDGVNDAFLPVIAGPLDRYELDIFNRWGQRIYTTVDRNAGWDGSFAGIFSQDGVYVWTLTYRVLGATAVKSERLSGHITLLR